MKSILLYIKAMKMAKIQILSFKSMHYNLFFSLNKVQFCPFACTNKLCLANLLKIIFYTKIEKIIEENAAVSREILILPMLKCQP